MRGHDWMAARFQEHRSHLHAVAYRMLGSASEADDAVQDAWLRFGRSDPRGVDNLGGLLTTMVARACLDILRARAARHEETLESHAPDPPASPEGGDPEHETLLAEAVGVALLVVLERLSPAERVALVLHDTFAVPFDQIAAILGRSPDAARQLASRARRRVHAAGSVPDADLDRQREVADAFLAAARTGDFDALVAVLDPDVVLCADRDAVHLGASRVARGASEVARRALTFSPAARMAQVALVDGAVGFVVARQRRLLGALRLTITRGRITAIAVISDPGRLRELDLAVRRE